MEAKNSYEKCAELELIPQEQLLAIGVPEITFYRTARGLQALCPFHNDSKVGSFMFNPHTGIWKCFSCGEGGRGVIKFLMRLHDWDFLQAVDYLYEHRNDAVSAFKSSVPAALVQSGHKTRSSPISSAHTSGRKALFIPKAPISDKDVSLILQAFADSSPLSKTQRAKLQAKRGLPYSATKDFFKMPTSRDDYFWLEFQNRLQAYDEWNGQERLFHSLIGVPGFYWDEVNDTPSFVSYEGALGMLLHSPSGLVCGIDMRVPDNGTKSTRYIGFSSGSICERYPTECTMGTKMNVFVDVVPSFYPETSNKYKGIAITEGKFKAIHLSYHGYTALNIRGVANWHHVKAQLLKLGCQRPVTLAFDADSRTNPAVAKAAADLGRALMADGYEVQYLTWRLKDGKGFDDLCNNGCYCKSRVVPGQEFLETTLDPFLERAKRRKAVQTA